MKILLFAMTAVLILQLPGLFTSQEFMRADDFTEYWIAGRLNRSQENPYDGDRIRELQEQIGKPGEPIYMWNPIWVMPVAMLLSIPGYELARILWFVLSVSMLGLCAYLIWPRPESILVAFCFFPTIIMLRGGQIGWMLLLGLIGLSRGSSAQRRGMAAALLAFKPHVLYLVWVWLAIRAEWRVLSYAALTLLLLTSLAVIVNPALPSQYISGLDNGDLTRWASSTLGSVARYFTSPELFWLQFVPPLIGLLWLSRGSDLRRVVVVSVLTMVYGWTHDYVVLLYPILLGAREVRQKIAAPLWLAINAVGLTYGLTSSLWSVWVPISINAIGRRNGKGRRERGLPDH